MENVTTIQIDGIYRPEQSLGGKWLAVAYRQIPRGPNKGDRGGVSRDVAHHHPTRRDLCWFDNEAMAQAHCDKINKR